MPQTVWNNSTASYRGLSGDATHDSSTLEPFGPEVDQAIKEHAVREFPNECVGLVVDGKYVPVRNVHPNPLRQFRVSDEDLQTFANRIQGVAHSHPFVMPYPSATDMEQQILMDVPWAIASVTHDGDNPPYCMDLFWFGDTLPRLPLEGRAFRPGVQDCFALARDHYRTLGIEIPDFPRDHAWWQQTPGKRRRNLFIEFLQDSGFREITVNDLRPNDAFACPYATSVICHCGVFLEGEKVLHHFSNRKSEIVPAFKWVRRAMEGGKFYRLKGM